MKRIFVALMLVAGCRAASIHPVDERLLIALEEARAWQHRADLHLADGDKAAAMGDVEHAFAVAFPGGAPEGEETQLDALARLARLHLGPSEAEEERALADLARARTLATHDSFYRAHVETVAGEIYEARAARLDQAAPVPAKEARRLALDSYARAIAISQRVQSTLATESQL